MAAFDSFAGARVSAQSLHGGDGFLDRTLAAGGYGLLAGGAGLLAISFAASGLGVFFAIGAALLGFKAVTRLTHGPRR